MSKQHNSTLNIGIHIQQYFSKTAQGLFERLIVNELCQELPAHHFYLFTKNLPGSRAVMLQNLTPVLLERGLMGLFNPLWQQQHAMKKLIRQHEISRIINFDAPQMIKSTLPQWQLVKGELPANVIDTAKIKGFILPGHALREQLLQQVPAARKKVWMIEGLTGGMFSPVSFDTKLDTREKYSDNKEYFLCTDFDLDKEGFILLLKAFSLFKQRQQSSWKIVICLRSTKGMGVLEESLSSYKYRYDVSLLHLPDEEDLSLLTASAYALVSVNAASPFSFPVFEAFDSGVPAIVVPNPATSAYSKAVLTVQGKEPADLAEKMMEIYKDESLKNRLVENASVVSQRFHHSKTIRLLAQQIVKG